MNPETHKIEELPHDLRTAPPAPYMQFAIPAVGARVASFAGYHWKIKSINKDTQEVTLEQDGQTTAGQRAAAAITPASRG
jgi:hypothetical protein